jgi:hypothetical protein
MVILWFFVETICLVFRHHLAPVSVFFARARLSACPAAQASTRAHAHARTHVMKHMQELEDSKEGIEVNASGDGRLILFLLLFIYCFVD